MNGKKKYENLTNIYNNDECGSCDQCIIAGVTSLLSLIFPDDKLG